MSVCINDPRLAAYAMVKAIGKGSYGEVFLVRHGKDKKQFVMKNIKLMASSAKERLAAEQEASLLSKLQHPNIVAYKESFTDELGMLHIVMGYCEGGDLCSRLKTYRGQLLPETQVVEWFVQIALALQYLHERNILHRDLKTQNIFLSKNDIIKVGDLGIARVLDGSYDLAHTVIGTPYYMSPELFANKPYNHKSDIWALGCCVYEMATLKHAFTARNLNALMYKVLQGKVPPLPPSFSPDLSTLVHQMLGRSAKERPSVHQILRMEFVRKHIRLFLERAAGRKQLSLMLTPLLTHHPLGRPHRTNGEPSSAGRVCEGEGGRGKECLVPMEARRRSSSDVSARSEDRHSNKQEKVGDGSSGKGRRGSLTSLPQHRSSEGSSGSSPENSRQARAMARKPPRPLPPSPTVPRSDRELRNGSKHESKADSKPPTSSSENRLHNGKPPAAPGNAVSSARERRRRHKQREAAVKPKAQVGRVVLRSRSSSDPQRRNSVEREGGRETTDGSEEREGGRPQSSEVEDTDGPSEPGEGAPELQVSHPTPLTNGSGEGSPELLVPGPASRAVGSGEGHSSEDSNNEIEDFFTLLDTTLHLPEPVPRPHPLDEGAPQPRDAFTEGGRDGGAAVLPSGRLKDRIAALRHECLSALGASLMEESYQLLDKLEPEEAEEALLQLLGGEVFESHAAKLQQLKMCEDSLYEL